ncbi:hypothetical protein FRC09_017350 [Ceratobasidium sp. 395]|nr:hypothetical protein FRC09_017350 [Ceratobasidium sp. 395]
MSDESEWSDSEQGIDSQEQTSVLLGIPDGAITDPKDLRDPNVSRLGGKPNSPMDRVLYVFGCANAGCQRRPGSVRAFRQLRFNDKYAAKLDKRQQRVKEREDKESARAAAVSSQNTTSNPFSMGNSTAGGMTNVFGGGFGDPSPPEAKSADENDDDLASGGSEDDYDYEEEEEDGHKPGGSKRDEEVDALATALTSASINAPTSEQGPVSDWSAVPAYPVLYLNTVFEYISPPKPEAEKKAKKEGGKTGGETWDLEQYERAKDVDEVFQRFASRVAQEGEQYELGGTPLAFHTDDVYKKLFPPAPPAPGAAIAVTNAVHAVNPPAPPRPSYDPSGVAPCGHCGGRRVFECQLMPNIINLLKRTQTGSDESEEGRKKFVAAALGGQGGLGMEWGTCMVFVCEADCCDGRECWREEEVLVQWER